MKRQRPIRAAAAQANAALRATFGRRADSDSESDSDRTPAVRPTPPAPVAPRDEARRGELARALEHFQTSDAAQPSNALFSALVRYVGAVTQTWAGAHFLTLDFQEQQQHAAAGLAVVRVPPVAELVPANASDPRATDLALTRLAVALQVAARRALGPSAATGARFPPRWYVRVPYQSLRVLRRGTRLEVAAGLLVARDPDETPAPAAPVVAAPEPEEDADDDDADSIEDSSLEEPTGPRRGPATEAAAPAPAAVDEPPAKRARREVPAPAPAAPVPSVAQALAQARCDRWVDAIRRRMLQDGQTRAVHGLEALTMPLEPNEVPWVTAVLIPYLQSAPIGLVARLRCDGSSALCAGLAPPCGRCAGYALGVSLPGAAAPHYG